MTLNNAMWTTHQEYRLKNLTVAVFDFYTMGVKREKGVDGVTKVYKLCTYYSVFNTFPLMSPLSYANTS